MKTKLLLCAMIFSILTISCEKDEATDAEPITTNETEIDLKVDAAVDDISKMIDSQLSAEEGFSARDGFGTEDFASACVIVTRVPAFGTMLTPGTLVTKTINFGTVGCVMPNGNILKGKIIISFTFNPGATTQTINYVFENFYRNATKFEGTRTFIRTMSVATVGNPSHPIVTMNMDMTVTFPNNGVVVRSGTRTREIIAGFMTPNLMDNVFKITGNWTTTLPNLSVRINTITTPLIKRNNCPNIVEGTMSMVRNGNTATLNYGDGTCDNQAVLTVNGVSTTITLGN